MLETSFALSIVDRGPLLTPPGEGVCARGDTERRACAQCRVHVFFLSVSQRSEVKCAVDSGVYSGSTVMGVYS